MIIIVIIIIIIIIILSLFNKFYILTLTIILNIAEYFSFVIWNIFRETYSVFLRIASFVFTLSYFLCDTTSCLWCQMAGSQEVMRNCYLLIQETHVCKNFLCFLFTDSMFRFLVNIYIFQALNSICIHCSFNICLEFQFRICRVSSFNFNSQSSGFKFEFCLEFWSFYLSNITSFNVAFHNNVLFRLSIFN